MIRVRFARWRWTPLREACAVALLVLLVRPPLAPDPRPAVGAMNDDGIYVTLGRAIAEGRGYRSTYLPGDPVQVRYPPALPAVLAVLWRVGGSLETVTDLALALNAVLLAGAAALLYWLGRTRLALHPALAILFAVGPFFLDAALLYGRLVLSEPYFMAGWAAALALGYRVTELPPGRRRTLEAFALGLVLAATVLVRSQGVAIVPAVLAALVLKRAGAVPFAAALLGAAAPLAAWHAAHAAWVAAGPLSTAADEVSYAAWTGITSAADALRITVAATGLNTVAYLVVFSFYFGEPVLIGFLLVVALAVLATGGALRRLRSHPALVLSIFAVAGLTLAWPGTHDRLALPLLPFAGLLAAAELQRLLELGGPRSRVLVLAAIACGALSIGVRQVTIRHHVNARHAEGRGAAFYTPTDYLRRSSRLFLGTVDWVRANTTEDDVVMGVLTGGLFLHTGRRAVPAEPARPIVGGRHFAVPGAYLAHQILAEGPTVLLVHEKRVGRPDIAGDVDELLRRCPGVLVPMEGALPDGIVAAYRIHADRACLEPIARANPWLPDLPIDSRGGRP